MENTKQTPQETTSARNRESLKLQVASSASHPSPFTNCQKCVANVSTDPDRIW